MMMRITEVLFACLLVASSASECAGQESCAAEKDTAALLQGTIELRRDRDEEPKSLKAADAGEDPSAISQAAIQLLDASSGSGRTADEVKLEAPCKSYETKDACMTKPKVPKCLWTCAVGSEVMAAWPRDGKDYKATIVTISEDKITVKWDDDGTSSTVPTSKVKCTQDTCSDNQYELVTSGTCDDWITNAASTALDKKHCEHAARRLGLTDQVADDYVGSARGRNPPYCFLSKGKLKYNSGKSRYSGGKLIELNTGSCSEKKPCLCLRARDTDNIEFGGSGGDREVWREPDRMRTNWEYYLVRPSFVTSKSCTATKCVSCEGGNCFSGVTEDYGQHGVWGMMAIQVDPTSAYTQYTLEVWASCDEAIKNFNSASQWKAAADNGIRNHAFYSKRANHPGFYLEVMGPQNGRVQAKVDDIEQYDSFVSPADNGIRNGRSKGGSKSTWRGSDFKVLDIDNSPSGGSQITIIFTPEDVGQKSSTSVWLEVYKADKYTDKCLSLKRDGCSTSAATILQDMLCKSPGLLAQQSMSIGSNNGAITHTTATDPKGPDCITPSPKTVSCPCSKMFFSGGCAGHAEGTALTECLTAAVCKEADVCSAWKKAHCDLLLIDTNVSAMAAQDILMQRSGQAVSLDDSLSGKRTC